ncbi:MAG: type II 3-dehydroquinate dehydratase [Alphaproteobacteria bacterium]|nr:type II 3-dehydroquinate dehydratase [Alphaproteobacteria bacterium]
MAALVLVLNGPNLNLLGTREPEVYGTETLRDIQAKTEARGKERGLSIDFRQSNAEHDLIDWIQAARGEAAGIILNAGAFTHTSVAIADALAAVAVPMVEVHLSNIFRREHFRHHSHMSRLAEGLICGFGSEGYVLAVDAMASILARKKKKPAATASAKRTPARSRTKKK